MRQKRYSSDVTDSQWQQVRMFFNTDRRRKYDLRRDVLDGILYLIKTGCQWRMLLSEFAPWQAVYYYFRRWRQARSETAASTCAEPRAPVQAPRS